MFGANAFGWPQFGQAWSQSTSSTAPPFSFVVVAEEASTQPSVIEQRVCRPDVATQSVTRPTVSEETIE